MEHKKRKRYAVAAAIVLLAFALLAGWCAFYGKSGQDNGAGAQYHDTIQHTGFASEDGIYHRNSTGFLYFFDYQTQQDVIVCNKPNCAHGIWYESTPDEQRCNAYLPDALGGAGFVQGEFLYLFYLDLNAQKASLIRTGLDRTSPKEIASFESSIIGPFVADGQFLYLSGCAILMEENEDGMEVPTGENETWLFRVNLKTGETDRLTERKRAYSSDLYIAGFHDGRIYYKENYFDEKYDGTNYEEAGHRVDWYVFDTKKGQASRIYEDEAFQEAYLYEGRLVSMLGKRMETEVSEDGLSAQGRYDRIDIAVRDLDTGATRQITTADRLQDCTDGKVFFIVEEAGVQRYYYYDIEQEKTAEMSREFLERLHIRGAFGDYLLVIKDDPDTGTGDFFTIRKQDFYNGEERFIPITWKEGT